MGMHSLDRQHKAALHHVQKADISERNRELILQFVNDIMLDGLTISRQIRYLGFLKLFALMLKKDFDKATKQDIKNVVGMIQQRDYSPWTRHCHKVMIRRFYKWLEGTETFP